VPILLGSFTVSSGVICGSVLNLSFFIIHIATIRFSLIFRKRIPVANTCFVDNSAYLTVLENGSVVPAF
jgi:hypothetical protein